MANIFVTSDSHYCNEAIIRYTGRPFYSSEEQTNKLIANWNNVVAPEDTVIHLGDFIMGEAGNIYTILPRLNGNIILCRGNHETDAKLDIYREFFADKVTLKEIHYERLYGLFFIFCHFPMTSPEFLDMVRRDNSEVCVVHGHVHDKLPFFNPDTHSFNVCVEVTSYTPVNLKYIAHIAIDDFQSKGVRR